MSVSRKTRPLVVLACALAVLAASAVVASIAKEGLPADAKAARAVLARLRTVLPALLDCEVLRSRREPLQRLARAVLQLIGQTTWMRRWDAGRRLGASDWQIRSSTPISSPAHSAPSDSWRSLKEGPISSSSSAWMWGHLVNVAMCQRRVVISQERQASRQGLK